MNPLSYQSIYENTDHAVVDCRNSCIKHESLKDQDLCIGRLTGKLANVGCVLRCGSLELGESRVGVCLWACSQGCFHCYDAPAPAQPHTEDNSERYEQLDEDDTRRRGDEKHNTKSFCCE